MPVEHPQLKALAAELEAASAHAERWSQVPEYRFCRRPQPQSWSAAECVRHLSLTTGAFLPLIDQSLAVPDAQRIGPEHRYRRNLAGWLLAWYLEPPSRLRTKTTRPFEPIETGGRDHVLGEFARLQRELMMRVDACEGRDLERHRIVSPFSEHVRYNLFSTLPIVTAHERRHLWQADRAIAAAGGS